ALVKQGHGGFLRQAMLLDFEQGTATKLTDAPVDYGNLLALGNPVWVSSREVVLVGAPESLVGVSDVERARRAAGLSVLSLDPVSRTTKRIAFLPRRFVKVSEVQWDASRRLLRFRGQDESGSALPFECFHRNSEGWERQASCSPETAGENARGLSARW